MGIPVVPAPSFVRREWRPLVFALLLSIVAVAVTRATWPFFSVTPYVPVFFAVVIATQWLSGTAGIGVAILCAAGAWWWFPQTGRLPFEPRTIPFFFVIAIIGNRVLHSRNRANAALRASEAQLRKDVTARLQAEAELRASEARLRRAQKMEAVGQLVAGVAHNFNNLLTVTLGYTDILLEETAASGRDAVYEIRKATERGAALTRQLLAFGRRHDPHPIYVDLAATLGGLGEMLTRVIREDIRLTIAADAGCGATIDPYDLEQVIVNLVINARDALPGGGTVEVGVTRERLDSIAEAAIAPGEFVRLRVRDDGVGMTPDVQSHLFEPFFTTKPVGEGTGLGLAFVHGIAEHGGGFVRVDSAPGKGTTVSVYLPLAPPVKPASAAVTAPPPIAEAKPRNTILLVEDDDGVRQMTQQMLTRAGYQILTASGPREALATFAAQGSAIDLLLTDIVMPDMHGPVLAAEIRSQRPEIPVLFVSGYSDAMPMRSGGGAPEAFLPKPFTAGELSAAVSRLLNAVTRQSG